MLWLLQYVYGPSSMLMLQVGGCMRRTWWAGIWPLIYLGLVSWHGLELAMLATPLLPPTLLWLPAPLLSIVRLFVPLGYQLLLTISSIFTSYTLSNHSTPTAYPLQIALVSISV